MTLNRRKAQMAEPVWMKSGMYPDYYMATFHYQTDGWLSSKSASVYEVRLLAASALAIVCRPDVFFCCEVAFGIL